MIVDATYTDVLKPDPQAYASCAAALRRTAPECVFVDDQLRNVAGARAAGMHAVHFDVRDPGMSFAAALTLLYLSSNETLLV